jgi:hypothetical protein
MDAISLSGKYSGEAGKMESIWKSKGKKLHARKIEVSTYNYDGQRLIVEGVLKDDRFQVSYVFTGETFPRGVFHHMAVRLLVNCSNLMIEDVDVELLFVPREVCREMIDCLAGIKGLTITKGFTLRVKKIAGGKKGCTHLVELLQAMAPAVFQGVGAFRSQKPSDIDQDHAKMMVKYLVNTCLTWREDGPVVEVFKKTLEARKRQSG